jgi:hypothetical protein
LLSEKGINPNHLKNWKNKCIYITIIFIY